MPSFKDMKKKYENVNSIGQQFKEMSDSLIQNTWYNDIQTRTCYIYDYEHDNTRKLLNKYEPNEESGKKKVDLKFIITNHKSLSKDDPEYHIQFSPEDWNSGNCIPDYYSYYEDSDIHFPIGLYVDIPNDRGIYEKWLVVYSEHAIQFPKFGVVKCNYLFTWITNYDNKRVAREMIGSQRSQNSYNSGIYSYTYTTKMENQSKFWLPWNDISSELYYNQRIIISMLPPKNSLKQVDEDDKYIYYIPTKVLPITYQISKIENTIPKGMNMFTIYQDEFNKTTDRIVYDKEQKEYKMYADYIDDSNSGTNIITEEQDNENKELENSYSVSVSCSTNQIKVGGGYKTISANCIDKIGDITSENMRFEWSYYINNENVTDRIVNSDTPVDYNKVKIKLSEQIDERFIGNQLTVKCNVNNIIGQFVLDIVAL